MHSVRVVAAQVAPRRAPAGARGLFRRQLLRQLDLRHVAAGQDARMPRPGTLFSKISFICSAPPSRWPRPRPARPGQTISVAHHRMPPSTGRPPRMPCCSSAASTSPALRGSAVTNSWKIWPLGYRRDTPADGAQRLCQIVCLGQALPCGLAPCPPAPWPPYRRRPSGRTGPRWSRCCCWPSPGGCAAHGPAGSGRRQRSPSAVRGLAHDAAGELAHQRFASRP